jgi:addiction module RelE/StbE family toxin
MKPVHFSAKAADDLVSICSYIHHDNPEAAARVRQTILNAAEKLELHPELGPVLVNPKPRHKHIRMLLVKEYVSYMLIYRVETEMILILRLLHAAQDWTRFFK